MGGSYRGGDFPSEGARVLRDPRETPSVRAALLMRLTPRLDEVDVLAAPSVVVRTEGFPLGEPAEAVHKRAHHLEGSLAAASRALREDRIFVRACPHDESIAPHLSFAGVFDSYIPRRRKTRAANLVDGTAAVMLGRRSPLADYYYDRHELRTPRAVDLWLSNEVVEAAMAGTAYVCAGRILASYFDTPLSIFARDPRRFAARTDRDPAGLEGRLTRSFAGLAALAGSPLDVEFIVGRSGAVYVIQVRPMSPPHVKNWAAVAESTWAAVEGDPPSAQVNSVGRRSGRLVDLRERPLDDDDGGVDPSEVLWVVRHRPADGGTSTLDLLKHAAVRKWRDVAMVVDHDGTRADDHLQYVVAEDPAVTFVAHATRVPDDLPSGAVRAIGDGFAVEIVADRR